MTDELEGTGGKKLGWRGKDKSWRVNSMKRSSSSNSSSSLARKIPNSRIKLHSLSAIGKTKKV